MHWHGVPSGLGQLQGEQQLLVCDPFLVSIVFFMLLCNDNVLWILVLFSNVTAGGNTVSTMGAELELELEALG